ncbi:hypothetical protein [Isoptericola sp. b408]|uniref:hypothetical protein n=1 Tax=Isoptericola sp. b408 TaxID=3064653 RepID=UPI002712FFA9|nr:hypothetical protein [Isoptericola sp. b408]MDO8152702.1 hypothetical protein [Isoptericola sp. b408]
MTAIDARQNSLLLPEGARLFHIGLPKTGTTHLQNAAAALREPLLEHGVLYPGRTFNHRREVSSFMGRGWGWGQKPTLEHWERLQAEIEADPGNRIWFGHEFASEASVKTVKRFQEAIGERMHVVVTLRHYGSILASSWQQYMKMGATVDFESWLEAVLADPPDRSVTRTFHTRNNQGLVLSRWAKIVGAENVTAIVIDKATPNLLTDAFEDLLGLPRDFLTAHEQDGFSSNRGMSVDEAELLRAVNTELRRQDLPWSAYEHWMRQGVAGNLMTARKPGDHDAAFELPRWAAEKATERGTRYADKIEATGVRVVGDLDVLRAPARWSDDPVFTVDEVPLEAAKAAVIGAIEAGLEKGERLERATGSLAESREDLKKEQQRRDIEMLERFKATELASEVARRAARRVKGLARRG